MPSPRPWRGDVRSLRPMLATLEDHRLDDPAWVYEPKYDGIRALASIDPGGSPAVRLLSRLGNDKAAQFPELVRALTTRFGRRAGPLVLDGEIVALDAKGEPAGFQQLQGRIHVTTAAIDDGHPVAFLLFDLLRDGDDDLCDLPLTERRTRLLRVFGRATKASSLLRLSEQVAGNGRELWSRAMSQGWEGLIAKRAASPYRAGKRSPDWAKLKLVAEQEFVVGGWTEPRGTRAHFGALLLGVYDEAGALQYVGHTGAGFDHKELTRLWALLRPLETKACPFAVTPKSNERPHWTEPRLVAQVKFTEWTDDDKLRHPTYLGLRDDKDPRQVRREAGAVMQRRAAGAKGQRAVAPKAPAAEPPASKPAPRSRKSGPARARPAGRATRGTRIADVLAAPHVDAIVDALQDLESRRRDGAIELPGGERVEVSNLHKVFWPELGITKGELIRYYARVSPVLLPVVKDRPLVMKRFPNGVTGQAFYQQRAPDKVPAGVRVETLESDTDVPSRLIGGSLKTLLYMAQLAVISQDPWFSRVQAPALADQVAIDLDPGDGVPFTTVLDVARWVRDELSHLGAEAYPKTSGSDGLHIFLPMPRGTPYEAGMLYCQIVATMVAMKHPKQATVERTVKARKAGTVYVDYLQNIEGKTLACAYSARASAYAGASTPVTWDEIDEGFDRQDFTIRTLPDRLRQVGDLWAGLRGSKGIDLHAVERYAPDTKR